METNVSVTSKFNVNLNLDDERFESSFNQKIYSVQKFINVVLCCRKDTIRLPKLDPRNTKLQ